MKLNAKISQYRASFIRLEYYTFGTNSFVKYNCGVEEQICFSNLIRNLRETTQHVLRLLHSLMTRFCFRVCFEKASFLSLLIL